MSEDLETLKRRFDALWMRRLDRILPIPTLLLGGLIAWYGAWTLGCILAVVAYVLLNVVLSRAAARWPWVPAGGALRVIASAGPLAALVWAAGPDSHGWILGILPVMSSVFAENAMGRTVVTTVFISTAAGTMALIGSPPQIVWLACVVLSVVGLVSVGLFDLLLEIWLRAEQRGAELERANAALSSALDARQRFLATMSHEVRTPMNGVVGTAELLDQTDLDAEQRRLVGVIQDSGQGLLAVLNDILDTARLDAGAVELETVPYDPAALATGVLDLLRPSVDLDAVALVGDLDEDLPERVMGDPSRLRQVLLNLVGNAIKFTDDGRVELVMRWSNDRLQVEVRDSGIGIPEDVLDDLFDPFVQAERGTARRYGGTGLGLTISHRLVALMGGSLTVSSEVGVGSTFAFTVTAPRAAAEAERAPEVVSVPEGLRVLVVDDNPVNLMVASSMLERLGCQVRKAEGGRTAIDAVQGETFDVVLMDCRMPDIDGLEATRQLRADGHTLPILALTAGVTEAEQDACREAGMVDVLAKPLSLDALRAALGRWAGPPSSEAVG